MGTIKIGSSANRKGITVEPSVVLFNGSNVKKIMSGLVTIWEDIKALVPTMTSNTTPYGVASASNEYQGNQAWYAFDNNNSTFAYIYSNTVWLQYKFTNPTCAKKLHIEFGDTIGFTTYNIQASNDGSSWSNLVSNVSVVDSDVSISNNEFYLYYRISTESTSPHHKIKTLQFYGIQLEALVPTMTSDTAPYGECSASSYYNASSYKAWNAFDGYAPTGSAYKWVSAETTNQWICYKAIQPINVRYISIVNEINNANQGVKTFRIEYSDNGTDWLPASDVMEAVEGTNEVFHINSCGSHLYWRLYALTSFGGKISVGELQFYK